MRRRARPVPPVTLRPKALTRARRSQPLGPDRDQSRHARTALAVSVLVALTLIGVDAAGRPDSPVEPLRTGAAEVFGPLEAGADAVVSPAVDLASLVARSRRLQADNARLTDSNARLRAELATGTVDRNRLAEYDALTGVTDSTGFELVNARVIAIGPAQAFRRTVTINAGTADGVRADRTVVNSAGLVGRVLRTGRHTATVLLAIDAGSVVGGRLDRSMELGFLRGNGSLGADGRLVLDLVDPDSLPAKGDTIVTWGSRGGTPYVPGVPVGTVRQVQASAGDQSVTATVRPFVDMSSLDLVGVVTGPRVKQPAGKSAGRPAGGADAPGGGAP
ncbi:rod shape-determining protein MreC [soil metagenome]